MRKKPYKIGSTSVGWANIEIWYDPCIGNCEGKWVPDECRIYIGQQAIVGGERDTIIHELIHAADSLYCLKLSERKVRELATCVVQGWTNLKFKLPRR